MYKSVIPFILLTTLLTATPALCQYKTEEHRTETVAGTVSTVDSVGNIIGVRTAQGQMAFSVPDHVTMTRNTHVIGLMDIREGDPVTVQYYKSARATYVVETIIDNKVGTD